jgi:quinoprotein dehydrogenase-associated probable ABC transporter substrate-binding protein
MIVHRALAIAAVLVLCEAIPCGPVGAADEPQIGNDKNALRVCADPNNWPLSQEDGTGVDNELARFVGAKLDRPVTFVWWAQRRGFIRNTLKADLCDVVMEVPAEDFPLAAPTRPYFRSSYVVLSREDRGLDIDSLQDPRLRTLRIGVHLIGDDGANTPPAQALGQLGIVGNVVGYPIYGDYRQKAPPQRLVEAVASGDVDIALVWGPLAGPALRRSAVPLSLRRLRGTEAFAPLRFSFAMAMGTRKDDVALRTALDAIIASERPAIEAILDRFGVPRDPLDAAAAPQAGMVR